MMQILELSNLVEDKIRAKQLPKSTFVPFITIVPQRPKISLAPRTTPIKHFSKAEMWEHQEKWICYNCGEKFTQGHRCAEQKLYLLDVDSPLAPEISDDDQDPVDAEGGIQQLPVDLPA